MKRLVVLFLIAGTTPALSDGSPWLPADGATSLSAELTMGSTDEFFIGDESMDLNGDIDGTFLWLNAKYGYDDVWAFDFRTGYAQTSFETDLPTNFDAPEQEDFADTSFGVSYQFINEFEADNGWPTITARAGFTIGGDYETNLIEAIGDGASGVDLSILAGKSLTPSIAVFGDLTYRQRGSNVADGIKYLLSAYYTTTVPGLGFQAAAAGIRTYSDIDIAGPGFGVEQFPLTDRDSDWLILGVNYGLNNGLGFGLSVASVLSGKNVADSNIGTLSLSYDF